ncbi:GHKL domain-containing protein [Clostridiales bacterium FE2011]|nr:GHKL domain-containing protein [Clostridiales bacterium FE2011]QTE75527.1 GHKL domain-containing protein [Clostridiales bacterium FE2010]
MNWMFYAVDLIGNCMEEMVAISYFRSISGDKLKSGRGMISMFIIFTLFRIAIYFIFRNSLINMAGAVITFIAFSLMFEMTKVKRFIFVPILFILSMFSEAMVGGMLSVATGISVEAGQKLILFNAAGVLISKMVLISIIKVIQFIVPSFGERISGYLMVPLLMLPVASFMLIYILGEFNLLEGPSPRALMASCAMILLAFSNIGLFFLLEYQQREEKEKNRMQLMQKQTEGQIAFYRELAERQKISNKTMHDLKNQMFALSEAMKTDSDKTREIMESISGKIFAASPMTVTGIDAVDSLIFSKKQQMELHGIRYEQSVHISPGTSFDPLDLCVLLGNLLDNAIEANEKVDPDKRFVSLTITQQEMWLSITITNAAVETVKLDGKTIHTTKAQKELHGFGLSSVNEIAAKYQGNCTFRSTDHDFTAYLILQDA